ncbi:secretin N-terminal domain-containing protein [Stenotrophomonas acidaminiphila]|uniref:secretin N-terminal domain-containing protein n=1 Tax=Stenotrophomonas acidaminiphila TaxID=128780 RepID=UPI0028ACC561|nr:secretin N-terminal domain-containing protein [Stenotrophomonas acidaminiphila]
MIFPVHRPGRVGRIRRSFAQASNKVSTSMMNRSHGDLSRSRIAAWRVFFGVFLFSLLAGCASTEVKFPEPLRPPKEAAGSNEVLEGENAAVRKRPLVEEGPVLAPPKASASNGEKKQAPSPVPEVIPRKRPVAIVLEGVSIESFINVVFGMELGFGVQIDQSLRSRPELLSLSLTEPQAPAKAYTIAQEVLGAYGVKINELGGVLQFQPANQGGRGGGDLPALIATRSLPDVPAGQRTVFVAMPLEISQPGAVAAQVRGLFGAHQVSFTELADANALLISGPGDAVRAAMSAVLTLDGGGLIGKRSLRINPLYLPADLLAKELRDVLAGQGISVRSGPGTNGVVTFVPVSSANALLVFSESEAALKATQEWADRLDQPSEDSAGGGMYLYAARHTTVETLLPVLQSLLGAGASVGAPRTTAGAGPGQAAASGGEMSASRGAGNNAGSASTSISGQNGQVAVDPIRNVIVFQGEAQRWRAIQGVLARLDQPARQVVIEVTVAEVTMTDEFSHGVEWALRNISINGMSGPVTALQGLAGTGGGGLVWQGLSSSGQVKAILNLFAKDSRVSILSTPRILVKSGESASIDVGTEVPIITSQATAPDLPSTGGNSSILQSVQYRKTGVLLDIEAVVHSGQRVDLKISQEVSEATPTDTSEISSPSVFSRKLKTSLSLADGESTLLGGLISSNRSDGKTKVPLLGDIPVLGRAFQSRKQTGTRTELLMLITPYVVEDAAQTRAITDAIRSRFGAGESWGEGMHRQPVPLRSEQSGAPASVVRPDAQPEQ